MPYSRQLHANVYYALIALAVAITVLLMPRFFFPARALENIVEDIRLTYLQPAEPQSSDIVIIAIDEEALALLPYRSPIDRDFIADVIDTLAEAGVTAIGLDILIDQPTEPAKDARLRSTLHKSPVPVVVATSHEESTFTPAQRRFHEEFLTGVRTGYANLNTERVDGTVREFQPESVQNGERMLSLPALLAEIAGADVSPEIRRIAWRAPPNSQTSPFPVYSASTLKWIPTDWLQGRIALIGTDLSGIDRHRTPQYLSFERGLIPGVEIHAHVTAQLLEKRRFPRAKLPLEALMAVMMAILGVVLQLWRQSLWLKAVVGVIALALIWAAGFLLFQFGGPLLPLVLPTASMGAAGGFTAALNAFISTRQAKEAEAAYHESQAQLEATSEAKRRIEVDLNMAREIQLHMVPSVFPAFPDRNEFDLHAIMDPAKAVGGDLYDFFFIDENRLFFMIGDVSDKGVPAALFMAMTKTLFKSAFTEPGVDLATVMVTVNDFLIQNNASQQFVTVFASILDTRNGELQYSDGGHDPPFLLRQGKGVEMLQKKSGIALGAFPGAAYQTVSLSLAPGDGFLLYTDGVNEAMNNSREMFEFERIEQAVSPLCDTGSAGEITTRLMQEVKTFAGDAPQSDDITILAIRYLGRSADVAAVGPATSKVVSAPS